MKKDRKVICDIVSDMLDLPDEHGIYPTSTAYNKLEHYIESVRAEAIGWCHADCCVALDRGEDPRTVNVPSVYDRAQKDLSN